MVPVPGSSNSRSTVVVLVVDLPVVVAAADIFTKNLSTFSVRIYSRDPTTRTSTTSSYSRGPVKKVYLGVLFWCTSEKGVLILTLNGEKGVLFFFNQNKMLLPK